MNINGGTSGPSLGAHHRNKTQILNYVDGTTDSAFRNSIMSTGKI